VINSETPQIHTKMSDSGRAQLLPYPAFLILSAPDVKTAIAATSRPDL